MGEWSVLTFMFECKWNRLSAEREWGTTEDSYLRLLLNTRDDTNCKYRKYRLPIRILCHSLSSFRQTSRCNHGRHWGRYRAWLMAWEREISRWKSVVPFPDFPLSSVVNSLSCNLEQAFEILQPIIRLVPLDILSRFMSAYAFWNRFSSLIHLERCARDPLDTLSMLKVRGSLMYSSGTWYLLYLHHSKTTV